MTGIRDRDQKFASLVTIPGLCFACPGYGWLGIQAYGGKHWGATGSAQLKYVF
jgi:hypothetical protein